MEFSIKAAAPEKLKSDCVAVAVFASAKLSAAAQALDRACRGKISGILKRDDFDAKPGSTLMLYELAGVASEVLGFTTGAWHGGRAQRDWINAGRPGLPGRLNEVNHLVFKAADTPWRRARSGLAAMLKPDLFKEGIDGEAVDWACARLHQRPERHKLLVVVSDGCPMDGATSLANDAQYLDQHLREVVARHEQAGEVQVFGLGVGLDLSPYYSRAQAIDLSVSVGQAVFRDVIELLALRRWR